MTVESLEVQGQWWLPARPDRHVFGTLRWEAESGGVLQLEAELRPPVIRDNVLADGSIQKYREPTTRAEKQYAFVLGEVEHEAFTLLDSFQLSTPRLGPGQRSERVHVNRLLRGAWFTDPGVLAVDRVSVELRHLTGWVDRSGLTAEYPFAGGEDGKPFAVITAKDLPPIDTPHRGTKVRLHQTLNVSGDHVHDLGINQAWRLQLGAVRPAPLDGFMDLVSDVQDLVSIAVGTTAAIDAVRVHHPALDNASTRTPGEYVSYLARWSHRALEEDPVREHQMYFTLNDLGAPEGLARWLVVAERYRTELSRVMATRYSPEMFLEDRIMNISAALESLDTIRRGTGTTRIDYVERIRQCVSLAGQPFLELIDEDADEWAKAVRDRRNDLAHHRQRFRTDGSVGEHLHSEQLYWLFVACMLHLAEAPPAVFERIADHRQIRWLTSLARGDVDE